MVKYLAIAVLLLACTPDGTFEVIHHRSNGCNDLAQENSLLALRCVRDACIDGTGDCALEGDARVMRVVNGSLGDDLELLWIHDGTFDRTATCAADLSIPGEQTQAAADLAECRITNTDGSISEEPIPTLDDVLDELDGSPVRLYLELKASGDTDLDLQLAAASTRKVIEAGYQDNTVMISFSMDALVPAQDANLATACFSPSGGFVKQGLSLLRGGTDEDVDRCANAQHTFAVVPASTLDGSVVSHVRQAGLKLGVFAVDTADAFDKVAYWSDAIDHVYADDPSMYVSFSRDLIESP